MTERELVIANRNYSSWSMRAWVLMRAFDIPFTERFIPFDDVAVDSPFKRAVSAISPAARVPVLIEGDEVIWDSLAIAETLAERHPEHAMWPRDPAMRARARSICAEMHAGFSALRNLCPMNIEASLPTQGALLWRDQSALRDDVARLHRMWEELLARHGGPMLFGEFSIPDAYYAPVCMRLITYDLPISDTVRAYVERVRAYPAVSEWIAGALREQRFLVHEEPYRLSR